MTSQNDWYWSRDEEYWNGPHPSKQCAMAEAFCELTEETGCFVGRMKPCPLNFKIAGADEFINCNEDADFDDSGAESITSEAAKELEETIARITEAWVEKHGIRSHYRSLENVGETFEVPRCDLALAYLTLSPVNPWRVYAVWNSSMYEYDEFPVTSRS